MALLDFFGGGQAKGDSVFGSMFAKLLGTDGSGIAKKHREAIIESQEALLIAGKNDNNATIMRTDRKGNQMIGNYTSEFYDFFEGATLNLNKWLQTNSSFTSAQSTIGGLNFNNSAILTGNAYSIHSSIKYFHKLPRVPLQYKRRGRHHLILNEGADFGFGIPTTNNIIVPNGCYFKFDTSNVIRGVITYNGVEIATSNLISKTTLFSNTIDGNFSMSNTSCTNNYFVYDIIIDDDNVVFSIQDTETGTLLAMLLLNIPKSTQKMFGATALPIFERVYHLVTAPLVQPSIWTLTECQVLSLDWNRNYTGSEIAGNLGQSLVVNPNSNTQLELHTNSVQPANFTLSNTVAGSAQLGGRFQFLAVAGAETDYVLFGYQIPANNRYSLEGIRIDVINTGANVATSATVLEWSLGIMATAPSLAIANLRKVLGIQSFAIGDAIGKKAETIDIDFETPIAIESLRYIQVILRMPIGTATALQVIRGFVSFKGRTI